MTRATGMEADLLSRSAQAALERLEGEALVERTLAWSTINSGSFERDGLKRMRETLLDAVAVLPGEIETPALSPSTCISAGGEAETIEHGEAIRVCVRPFAAIQIALTGHYDTVFPANHPFQTPRRREDHCLHGPGVADMKGGLAIMLAALEAFEHMPQAKHVGYEILLSPDEEVGSPASAALLTELGKRAHVGMTYEPALADGALVGARKGSGNFSLAFRGRAAHVGRAFAEGRNAIAAAADRRMRFSLPNMIAILCL